MNPPDPAGRYGDLVSLAGVPGQNTPTPSEKIFFNHIIVHPALGPTVYYDASYGITHSSEAAFEQNIFGYVTRLTPTGAVTAMQYVARPKNGLLNIRFGDTPW
jgi:hypothetical protein